jgi:signal transduction histidine kinase
MQIVSKVVDTEETFGKELTEFSPDVILCDHNLHQFNSIDAIRIFKKHHLSIPFILVTGSVSEEFAVDIMKEGADDYILKLNLTRLPTAIEHALEKKRLESERKLAMESLYQKNQELNNLIRRCAHDLRGPLTSLMGLVQLSQQQEMSDTLSKYVSMMETSVRKLDIILKGFREYTTVTSDTSSNKEIFFGALVTDILQSLENISGYAGTKFNIDIQQTKGFLSNEFALRSILQNLIHNAILYREKAKNPEVNISVHESGYEVVIKVSDNGIGIPEKIHDKVFEMSYRGSSETEGSGLGLYLVKNAVVRLNGTIAMKSKPGEGTSFEITLPAK